MVAGLQHSYTEYMMRRMTRRVKERELAVGWRHLVFHHVYCRAAKNRLCAEKNRQRLYTRNHSTFAVVFDEAELVGRVPPKSTPDLPGIV